MSARGAVFAAITTLGAIGGGGYAVEQGVEMHFDGQRADTTNAQAADVKARDDPNVVEQVDVPLYNDYVRSTQSDRAQAANSRENIFIVIPASIGVLGLGMLVRSLGRSGNSE
jgi:hypothetical protein